MRRRIRWSVVAATVLLLSGATGAIGLYSLGVGPACQAWDLDIDRAMDAVGLAPGMVVGEAGAGDGYFTLPMARRVAPSGAVYANDINRRALDRLSARAGREGLSNVRIVEGEVADPRFPRNDLDLIVIVHAFHDFDRPVEWLVNARKYLRPGGAIAIIDRDPGQGAEHHFWTRERILGYAAEAGYGTRKLVDGISQHLIIVLAPHPA
jgi:ubiquinone/menaquinone biosynthesis C-methylase UbiE